MAIIGHPPESRGWKPGDLMYEPILEEGVRVEAFVTVDAGLWAPTHIGARSWLFKHVHIGHDADIGEDCEISSAAVVGGHCVIGDRTRIGINATIKPFVTIGSDCKIGCGAVVTKNVPPGEVWAGNPAKKITKDNNV